MSDLTANATAVAVVAMLAAATMLPLLCWLCISSEPWDDDDGAVRPRPLRARADDTPPSYAPDSQAAALLRARRPPRGMTERADNLADASAGGAARDIEGRRKHRQAPHAVDQSARGSRPATKAPKPPAAASSSTNAPSATRSSTKVSAAARSPTKKLPASWPAPDAPLSRRRHGIAGRPSVDESDEQAGPRKLLPRSIFPLKPSHSISSVEARVVHGSV
jgi:hypothetical protein